MISVSTSTSIPTGDFAMCEICDNYTPQVFVESELESGCQYCWEAYGELNQFPQLSVPDVRIQLERIIKWIQDSRKQIC